MVHCSVHSLLTGRDLIVLSPLQTVFEAAGILSSQIIGGAPVLEGDQLVGIFTERDVLRRVVAADRDPKATRVGDVMTPRPRTIEAVAPLVKAFAMMCAGQFRHLPVMDGDGTVVAMLSMRDIPVEYRILHQQWSDWTRVDTSPAAVI